MRAPRQHKLFKIENQVGLSTLLAGRTQDQVVKFVSGIPGLAVLTAGPTPPNPEELLGRSAFGPILEQSMSKFDVVLIDTPALDVGGDVTLLSRFAGAALVVTRLHQTRTNDFYNLVGTLEDSGTRVVGSVLVDVPKRKFWRRKAS
jgi:Mrp family chromosome partitioning ATPase